MGNINLMQYATVIFLSLDLFLISVLVYLFIMSVLELVIQIQRSIDDAGRARPKSHIKDQRMQRMQSVQSIQSQATETVYNHDEAKKYSHSFKPSKISFQLNHITPNLSAISDYDTIDIT